MKSISKCFILALIVFLYSGCSNRKNSELKPGYDKAELTALLPVLERVYDTSDIGGFKTPEPVNIKMEFRSKTSPIMNRFDVWKTDDKKAIIPIRGTIVDKEALSFSVAFYIPMVPATGKIKISESKTFDYKLAEISGAGVHLGILLALGTIADELVAQIKKQYNEGIRDFIILGHSQGSGIACLATSYILYMQKDGKLPGDFRLKTYCVASPKIGNMEYANDYEKITMGGWAMSVNNIIDWVPYIGISMQSQEDFPKVSPFRDLKGFFSDINYKPGEKFDETAKKFLNIIPQTTEEFAKIIHENVYPKFVKVLPGYEEPPLLKTAYYERAGLNIPVIPNADYFKLFPNDPAKFQVWENHSVYPYYILVTTNY